MSGPSATAERQQTRQQGFIAGIVTFPFRLFGVLCGSLLLAVLVECLCIHFLWPEQRWRHAESVLDYELDQLSSYFIRSALVREPGRTAHRLAASSYQALFVDTGFLDWAHEVSARAHADAAEGKRFKKLLGSTYVHIEMYALAGSYVLLTFLVRLLVLCLMLPMFMMAAFVGLVDGLVRRDIRRFGAGRESGFVYHRAKASIMPLVVLPWVVYLALPVSVHPVLIFLPTAIALSLAVNIAAGSFKKYL